MEQTPVESKKSRILLVEDDLLLVKMYQTKFTMEGFELLVASDGEAGLQIAQRENIDFLILDIMLPKLSGIDVLEKLKRDPNKKDIPVLILTNLTQEEEAKKALALGAKEYLIKSDITPKDLIDKVRKYLPQTSSTS